MATRKSNDSMNIRAGDIPETDAEVEKLLAKKPRAKKVVSKSLVPAPEINPALLEVGAPEVLDSAEGAASGSGWQGEEIPDSPPTNQTVVTRRPATETETKDAQLDHEIDEAIANQAVAELSRSVVKQPKASKAPAPKKPATKQPKANKPKAEKAPKPATNPKGFAWITPEIVLGVFKDAEAGVKRPEIATRYNISLGSVSTILQGPSWFIERFTPRLAAIGAVYPAHPFKQTKKE